MLYDVSRLLQNEGVKGLYFVFIKYSQETLLLTGTLYVHFVRPLIYSFNHLDST